MRHSRHAGEIEWVEWDVAAPSFASKRKRKRGIRRRGILYERSCHGMLQTAFGDAYVPSPWLRFYGDGRLRWAQPDGILFDPEAGRLTIIEVKYSHTEQAWNQLHQLYSPLMARLLPDWPIALVEIVKWYDPCVAVTTTVTLQPNIDKAKLGCLNVHIWKP